MIRLPHLLTLILMSLTIADSRAIAMRQIDLNSVVQPDDTACAGKSISGILRDELGNPIAAAYVECNYNGVTIKREVTDFDGLFRISELRADTIDIVFKYQGMTLVKSGVAIACDQPPELCAFMRTPQRNVGRRRGHGCSFRRGFVDPAYPGGHVTYSGDQLW